MPYIHTTTNKIISRENEALLRRRMGEAIASIPGKSEYWLMLAFTDGCRMAFRGDAEDDCVMLEVSIFGTASEEALARLTRVLTDTVCEVLEVDGKRVYIKYTMTDHWGYNGENF